MLAICVYMRGACLNAADSYVGAAAIIGTSQAWDNGRFLHLGLQQFFAKQPIIVASLAGLYLEGLCGLVDWWTGELLSRGSAIGDVMMGGWLVGSTVSIRFCKEMFQGSLIKYTLRASTCISV